MLPNPGNKILTSSEHYSKHLSNIYKKKELAGVGGE